MISTVKSVEFERCEFECGGVRLAAKRWRPKTADGQHTSKIIAIHGWLDNAASFDFIAPHINADIICLDLAGHGQSSERKYLGAYAIWQDVPEVLAVADQLGWGTFSVFGHSRGAAVAFLLAATFPKRVECLWTLDGLLPLAAEANKAPDQLFHSICTVKKQIAREATVYSQRDTAIAARENAMFPVSRLAAEAFAERALVACEGGYRWCYDPKVFAPSEVRFTPEQVEAFAQRVTAPVFMHLAEEGIALTNTEFIAFTARYPRWQLTRYNGGHHFHMTNQAEGIAYNINEQIKTISSTAY